MHICHADHARWSHPLLSALDLFRIGIGPSSSHTVGPMRIARRFLIDLGERLTDVAQVQVALRGSLAFTGKGHATDYAVLLGLIGFEPETVDPASAEAAASRARVERRLRLLGHREIAFDPDRDIVFDYEAPAGLHPNAMRLTAQDASGDAIAAETYYSTGGGFIATRRQLETPAPGDRVAGAAGYAYGSSAELLTLCAARGCDIADIVLTHEDGLRPRAETENRLDAILAAMLGCIERGLTAEGVLPGRLAVPRRAAGLWRKLIETPNANERERLFDVLNAYAMAVNEENAAGGRVVTAPTNGAAGIIPATLRYYGVDEDRPREALHRYLLTAAGIGLLYKQRASISGAEMGCQGEVGVACSMAAAGLAALWGASPEQVTIAAEIGMEHNLGLTCDPVGGLVQIPCIERNAIGAVKAANAARLALHAAGPMKVSLDQVIETMRQTGLDMSTKYKETSLGGLAVSVVEC
jgi:L-serine dehydratase